MTAASNTNPKCLVYCPLPYSGRGPAQTCVSIVENIPETILQMNLFTPISRRPIRPSVIVKQAIPFPINAMPWRLISKFGTRWLNRTFLKGIEAAPKNSIAYFWPDPPLSVVRRTRELGLITVREMINSYRGTAKSILDDAYDRLGLPPTHGITEQSIEREKEELALYDYIFASNPMVEASLLDAQINQSRILPSSFGWSSARFSVPSNKPLGQPFTALFVGTVGVRKGIPQLLSAWKRSGVKGKLVLAGNIEEALRPLLKQYAEDDTIQFMKFTGDVNSLYRSADVFVFPTLEEGGPQVTYEAAGCGLPVLTTPMGTGRIIRDGINGFVIKPDDIDSLANALSRLAKSPDLRHRLGSEAQKNAMMFTYEKIGRERAAVFRRLV